MCNSLLSIVSMCVCHVPHGRLKLSTTAEDDYRTLRKIWWIESLHMSLCWPDVTLGLIFDMLALLQTMTWTSGSPYNSSIPQQASQRDTDLQEEVSSSVCACVFTWFPTIYILFHLLEMFAFPNQYDWHFLNGEQKWMAIYLIKYNIIWSGMVL